MKTNCDFCGIEFDYNPSQQKGKFCGHKCRGNHQTLQRFKKGTKFRPNMRAYLIEFVLEEKCCLCGQGPIWNDNPLILQCDHINGDVKDNRFENLRLICPNCHTQTNTWGSRNMSKEGQVRCVESGKRSKKKHGTVAQFG